MEDKEDVGELLVGGELAIARNDVLIKSEEILKNDSQPSPKVETKPVEKSTDSVGPAILPPDLMSTVPATMTVSREVLSPGSNVVAVVCYLESPDTFYICPTTSVDQFTAILTTTQDCPTGQVLPALGSCCLAQDDDCWYRAEIIKLSQGKTNAKVFLLDYGKTIQATVASLRPLPSEMTATPGLACKVSLKGIKPGGKEWSEDEKGGAELVLDVGNDTMHFNVKVIELNNNGEPWVTMKDTEGNDVASLMVETGIAVADTPTDEYVKAPLKYQSGSLALGLQTVVILSAVNPMELYLCSQEMFLQLSTSMAMIEQAAASSTVVASVLAGDPVLACDDGIWYRAMVTKVMGDDMVQVDLVDLASTANLHKTKLQQVTAEVMKGAVVAVSCCLDTWVGEEKKIAIEKWGDKMAAMVEQYEEMQVEVVGLVEGGQFRVRIPDLEKKLKGEVKSRAEMLKEKLRRK